MSIRTTIESLAASLPKRECLACGEERLVGEFRSGAAVCISCQGRHVQVTQKNLAKAKVKQALDGKFDDSVLGAEATRHLVESIISGRIEPGLAKDLGVMSGEFTCPYCEMRFFDREEAADCCAPGIREYESRHGALKELGTNHGNQGWV